MRKLLVLLLILVSVIAEGRKISESEAAAIASEFLNSATVKHPYSKAGVRRVKARDGVNADAAPFYVYNADGNNGFVIVSGDDRATRILGYSDTGSFDYDNLPPQLDDLLKQYAEQLKNIPEATPTHDSWKAPARTSEEGGVLLETANWGQGAPYNSLCPTIDGVQAQTGCVATAMAIVMKYHNWPENYDWTAMPIENVDVSNSSEIASLMKDAGESVLMQYTSSESSANMNFVGHRLQQRFKYSPECQFITAKNFTNDQWTSMLKSNLDSGNPVIYNGTGSGNHAFIIDGYDNDVLYHVNWGWDGLYNGMYALNALTPGSDNYNDNAGMVINIVADKSDKEYSNVFCDYGYFWGTGGLAPGTHFSVDTPERNQKFDFTCLGISYPCDENGEIGLLLFDKDGNVKEVLKNQIFTEQRDDGINLWSAKLAFFDIFISSEISTDDYLSLATRKTLSDKWHEVLGTIEGPVKQKITDIKKDVAIINIINDTPWSITLIRDDSKWLNFGPGNKSTEWIKGHAIQFIVLDESGNNIENCSIIIDGISPYGDKESFVGNRGAFATYGDDYTITIEDTMADIEKVVNLKEAGTLSEALKDIKLSKLGSLTISGFINAEDLWFIRDNAKFINTLDLSDAKIMASEANDPVEAFRISGPEHYEDELPTYALTSLKKLETLKLPKDLKYIGSNSMMYLAISRIELPSTVQSMGLNLFFDCANLKTVVCHMPQPVFINDCIFTSTQCPSKGVLYVPMGSYEAYNSAVVWQDFAQIIEDDNPPSDTDIVTHEGLKYRIHGKALYLTGYEQSQLPEDVVIPDVISVNGYDCTVLGIDDGAMQTAEMNSFTMSNTITTIGSYIFEGSNVVKVHMSDNIKYLPFCCIDGYYIEELHLPENAELIGNAFASCHNLKKIHLPKKLKSEAGYSGSIGYGFDNLEEITVDPENEEWSVYNGMLFWNGLSRLILVPNYVTGEIVIPDETTEVGSISCNGITTITLGSGIKTLAHGAISFCQNLKHINFNSNILFELTGLHTLPSLESFTIRDFIWSYDNCFCNLPSLKYVYLLNENPVDFGGTFYNDVNPSHDYFTPSLNPQATIPDGCRIFVAGGVKDHEQNPSNNNMEEMWTYEIDRANGKIKVEPLIDGLVIDAVTINGVRNERASYGIYYYTSTKEANPDVVVDFTLHERQAMTTHYDADFNATIPDSEIFALGDTNGDGGINIADAVNIANHIIGLPTTDFRFAAADVNKDDHISVSDVSATITIIQQQSYSRPVADRRAIRSASIGGSGLLSCFNAGSGEYDFAVDSETELTALQFDVKTGGNCETPEISIAESIAKTHNLTISRVDESTVRVILFSPGSDILPQNQILLVLNPGQGGVPDCTNIYASDEAGQAKTLRYNAEVSGLSDISTDNMDVEGLAGQIVISNASGREITVSDMLGKIIFHTTASDDITYVSVSPGIYIVRVGVKPFKVFVK